MLNNYANSPRGPVNGSGYTFSVKREKVPLTPAQKQFESIDILLII